MGAGIRKPVIIVAGPTASGKSALALSLAQRFGGEIVNADSMQVYREFRVLTARPEEADEGCVPHHLYGILPIENPCSAGMWLDMALPCIMDIHARDRLPIVCGGTGLYLKVLSEGIAPVPDVPEADVEEAARLYSETGGTGFLRRLSEFDPIGASRLEPGDRQRLIRAYSVILATGRSLSDWQAEQTPEPPLDAGFFTIHLIPPRQQLYQRIDARLGRMVDKGALDEVRAVQALKLDPALPALKALGVPDFQRYLSGEVSLQEATDKARQHTRNFAKRQLTWFRNQSKADLLIEGFGGEGASLTARTAVEDFIIS